MGKNGLGFDDIGSVTAHVHQGAIDVLGPVTNPVTVHQSQFSMGPVLGLIARYGPAGLPEFDPALYDPDLADFRQTVGMVPDTAVDSAYPRHWNGTVTLAPRP